jgi:polyribonucleotide nucleotidyltransferase
MSEILTSTHNWNNVELKLETGKLAKQADGAVVTTLGQTTVLCTAVIAEKAPENNDFTDMAVYYQERFYAAGKIPGGFVKREGKPTEKETLTSRIIDRSLRPVVKLRNDQQLQVICTVLSYDGSNMPDLPALIGATAAIKLAGIDCQTVAGTRLCMVGNDIVINPTLNEIEQSTAELFVSGTKDAITMLECGAIEKSKQDILKALQYAHDSINEGIKAIDLLIKKSNVKCKKIQESSDKSIDKLINAIKKSKSYKILTDAFEEKQKKIRYAQIKVAEKQIYQNLDKNTDPELFSIAFNSVKNNILRDKIVTKKIRIDGRGFDEIRDIECGVGILPRVHGSGLFTRGETQVLSVITMGGRQDMQMVEDITSLKSEKFMLHYNFPPFSVGEVNQLKGVSRREFGHGNLARKAILAVLPNMDKYQYSIRAVAEVLECNGSSSMASVCASSLALMDAGVPIQKHVAGIAMGMIKTSKETIILSDIMGDEDHLGDMDFKLAGTLDGITAMQMDTKTSGVEYDVIEKILDQAIIGIKYIIARMHKAIVSTRSVVSEDAPKMVSMQIDKDSIRTLIGPGGKTIKEISALSKAKIDINDDGKINISASSNTDIELAIQKINNIILPFKIGDMYDVSVTRIADFGVFVKLDGDAEGFIHVSDLSDGYVEKIDTHVQVGQELRARMIGFDRNGKVKLTLKSQVDENKNEKKTSEKSEHIESPSKVSSKEVYKKRRFF